jgi:hypothetical protein
VSRARPASESVTVPVSVPAPVLQCYKISTRTHSAAQDFIVKKYCKWKVVYRIFTPEGTVLDACNVHFNEYFESHEIGPEMVMRLSDDEDDFIQAGHNKRESGESATDVGIEPEPEPEPEPICQVPRPRPKTRR